MNLVDELIRSIMPEDLVIGAHCLVVEVLTVDNELRLRFICSKDQPLGEMRQLLKKVDVKRIP